MLAGPGGPVTQGPVRVLPGRLSVSRTFGDCQAKMERYNGNPNVVIVDPEIHHLRITEDLDYVVLGCDGIFDRINTEQACQEIWAAQVEYLNSQASGSLATPSGKKQNLNFKNNNARTGNDDKSNAPYGPLTELQYHQGCGAGVDSLLIKAMKMQSLDNLSVVLIGLQGFKSALAEAWEAKQ